MATLVAVTPSVEEAVAEVSYPNFWLTQMRIRANDPKKVSIEGRLIPSRVDENGDTQLLKDNSKQVQISIPDVFAHIEADPTGKVAIAFNAIMEAIVEQVPETTNE